MSSLQRERLSVNLTAEKPDVHLMESAFTGRDLISLADLSKREIEEVLQVAASIKRNGIPEDLLKGKILASCFFEPSTRTRLSFEAAMLRLGGSVIGFSDNSNTSMQKGETLSDTMRVISNLCDLIVIRHSAEGSARAAADASFKPVINAGDGANQHPTQTLLDLFTIRELHGKIDGLQIAMLGDLRYSRTIHSLAIGLSHYAARLYFISSQELSLPEEIAEHLRKAGVKFSYHTDLAEVLPKLDILYMTRRQKERSSLPEKTPFVLRMNHLEKGKESLRVMHPLPRVGEIDPLVDSLPQAAYFQQAANGLPVRQALLSLILGEL